MDVRRRVSTDSIPSYFREKPWQKAERRKMEGNKRKTKDKSTRSIEEMMRDGETYSVSSGVQLKFQEDETGTDQIDWNRELSWENEDEIVTRYVFRHIHIISN